MRITPPHFPYWKNHSPPSGRPSRSQEEMMASKIAVREVRDFLAAKNAKDAEWEGRAPSRPQMEVTFCCFSERNAEVYERLLP